MGFYRSAMQLRSVGDNRGSEFGMVVSFFGVELRREDINFNVYSDRCGRFHDYFHVESGHQG